MSQYFKLIFIIFILFSFQIVKGQNKKSFTVVIDAGHGGGDPGAVNTRLGLKEKDIALEVCLRTQKLLSEHQNIEVYLTRKSDFFIEVYQRAEIANQKKADLFISVHLNSTDSPFPTGTETFVMGLSKSKSNLEVAKKENAVISLEKDYQTKYEGFDPSSPESMIGLILLQEQYLEQSISLARKLQVQYTDKLERYNRGVKQAVFLVLHKVAMPSVLTEIGFLSNDEEAKYMNSEDGKNNISEAIANAILSYKKEYYSNNENVIIENDKPIKENEKEFKKQIEVTKKENEIDKKEINEELSIKKNEIIFKIQIKSSDKKMNLNNAFFKSFTVSEFKEGKFYKYYYFETNSIKEAKLYLKKAKKNGFKDAFIVGFKDEKRVNIDQLKN